MTEFAIDALAFGAPNVLRLVDPLVQFRHNRFAEAHAFEALR